MEGASPHYFLALSVPEQAQRNIHELTKLGELEYFSSLTDIRDYHITLFFLGEVTDKQLEVLKEKLPVLVHQIPAFDVQLNQAGVFGKEERPRVLFAGVKRSQRLLDLHAAVTKGCVEAGFNKEKRPFRPHITIAKRGKHEKALSMQNIIKETRHWKDVQWRVKGVGLYCVRLGQTPRYQLQASFPLNTSPDSES